MDNWDNANTIFTIITQRDDTDSWRDSVISILDEVAEAAREDGYENGLDAAVADRYAQEEGTRIS